MAAGTQREQARVSRVRKSLLRHERLARNGTEHRQQRDRQQG